MSEWKVKLIEKIERTTDIKSFRFERPKDFKYLPGQFSYFYIPKEERGELFHHFSISSSPTEPNFIEFTTRIRESEYKQRLDKLPLGTTIKVSTILGKFILTEKFNKVVFICGGIGITAARSNIRWAIDTHADVDIILLYANRDLNNIAFKEELKTISEENFKVFHILSQPEENWKGWKGRINSQFILANVPDWEERRWYVSGPPAMVEAIENILTQEICVPSGIIKEEYYIGY